jgi:hypothetical protein
MSKTEKEVKVISESTRRPGMVEAVVHTKHKEKRFKQGKMKNVVVKHSKTVHVPKSEIKALREKGE